MSECSLGATMRNNSGFFFGGGGHSEKNSARNVQNSDLQVFFRVTFFESIILLHKKTTGMFKSQLSYGNSALKTKNSALKTKELSSENERTQL